MNQPPVQVLQAFDRLSVNSDFQMVTKWLASELEEETRQLLEAVNPVLVHKGQGYALAIKDFLQAATSANEALALLG